MTEPSGPAQAQPDPWAGAVEEIEIRVNREQLLQHLRRIYCGAVPDVTLEGPLSAKAISPATDLVVTTAGLLDIEPLPSPIGVELEPLIGTLNCLQGDEVELRLEGNHLVLASGKRRIRSQSIPRHLTGTQLDPQLLAALMAKLPDDGWQQFPADLCKGVGQAIRGLGADQVIIRVGPEGSTIIVGDPMLYSVEFDVPEVVSDTSYGVFIPPGHLQAVFAEVGDSQPAICLAGANGMLGLRLESKDRSIEPPEVEATYLISLKEGTGGSDGRLPRPRPPQTEPPPQTELREMDPRDDVAP